MRLKSTPSAGRPDGCAALLVVLLWTGGCGSADDGARAFATADGAASWSLAPDPFLELGVRDDGPEAQLFRSITRLDFLGDGAIAVVDAGARALRVFQPDGTVVLEIGGQGQGPGEFETISLAAPKGDGSFVLVDPRLARATTVGANGDIRDEPLPRVEGEIMTQFLGSIGARWFVGMMDPPPPTRGEVVELTGRFEVLEDGQLLDGGRLDIASNRFIQRSGGPPIRIPLSPRPLLHSSAAFLAVADPATATLFILREEGSWARSPLPSACEPVRPEEFRGEDREETRNGIPYDALVDVLPDCLPSHDVLRITSNGLIWLRRSVHPGAKPDIHLWDVLNEDAKVEAVAELPAAFTPFDMEGDQLLGRWIDPLGLHFIRVYRLD